MNSLCVFVCSAAFVKLYINKLEITDEYYDTESLTNLTWERVMFSDRSVFRRFTRHGYQYVFCTTKFLFLKQ